METSFFLPGKLRDKYPHKIDIKITFDDFIYEKGMIPVTYEYNLDMEDLKFLLKCIGENAGLNIEGSSLYKFLSKLYRDDQDIYDLLQDYIDYIPDGVNNVYDKLKEFCKSKAYSEFLDAFAYWVDAGELDDYFETEEIDDLNWYLIAKLNEVDCWGIL